MSHLGTPWITSQCHKSVNQIILIDAVSLLSIIITTAALFLEVESCPCLPGIQLLPLHLGFPNKWLGILWIVWPTEKSYHRVLQGCWSFPQKLISQGINKRYISWTFPVYVSVLNDKSSLTFQYPKPLNPFLNIKPRKVWDFQFISEGHLLVYVSTKQPRTLLEPFLTPGATILNAESLFSESISINSSWSNFYSYHHYPTNLVSIPTHAP